MARDKFDVAVDYLTQNPDQIPFAWGLPQHHKAGCLFALACPDGIPTKGMAGYDNTGAVRMIGCLTQIRENNVNVSAWSDLTEKIRADTRIPPNPADIKVSDLPVFAEYQREIATRGPGDLVLTGPIRP